MKFIAIIQQHIYQSVVVLILNVALCGIGLIYRQQAENQVVLQQLLSQQTKQNKSTQPNDQLIPLLKSIQANQTEIKILLTKLVASKSDSLKIPVSKMKRFKQGTFKPARQRAIR